MAQEQLSIVVPVKKTIKARDGFTDIDTEFVEIANPVGPGAPQVLKVSATVDGITVSKVFTHGAVDEAAREPTPGNLQKQLDEMRADVAEIAHSRAKVKAILPLLK